MNNIHLKKESIYVSDSIESLIDKLVLEIETLEDQLKDQNNTIEKLEQKVKDLEGQLSVADLDIADGINLLNKLEKTIKELKSNK